METSYIHIVMTTQATYLETNFTLSSNDGRIYSLALITGSLIPSPVYRDILVDRATPSQVDKQFF